ncbi:protein tyrosine phosphatase receptor type C-associated protein [Rhea pennata]|uniref:protein tyrosine phosphatase receptor type C-associated protein n=1 Tax=Rhea pennata TaxID=8795 RepID=UPI002E25CBC5
MATMQRCPRPPGLVLLALPGLVAASEPTASYSDRSVGTLLCILLCLAVGLALAWHHLCRLSAGRYHPRSLGQRALALLQGCWRCLQGCGRPGAQGLDRARNEAGIPCNEEELMPWPQDQHRQNEDNEEEEEGEEEEVATAALGMEADPGPEPADPEESPPSLGKPAGGSAEALLSDLHAFSGTAAWGDTRPHVTAL